MYSRPSALPQLAIADPSLLDDRGHHYGLTLQLTRGAQELGVPVCWLTHADFAAARPAGIDVHPVFSATMYDRYRPDKKAHLPPDLDRRLYDELLRGIAAAGLGATDHVYFHTGFGDLFRALPAYLGAADAAARPFLHVCTPYDHDTMPGKDPGPAVREVLQGLRDEPAVDQRLFLWAETPQLALHYVSRYGFNMRAMPLPPSAASSPAAAAAPDAAMTALYLGAAREEKGFLLLPELASRLYELHGRAGRLRFVIQCTPQIIGYKPSIRAAIDVLRALPAGYVTLIDSVMGEDDYHGHMVASDIVLLLYDRKAYRIRGSGIAVEAVCADKCLLTHTGTFCAKMLTEGAGAAVDDLDGAIAAIDTMVLRRDEYGARAARQGAAYRTRNSVTHYVRRILSAPADRAATPWLPSAVVGHLCHPLLRTLVAQPWTIPDAAR